MNKTSHRIMGWVVMTVTIVYSVIGLSSQILENWRRGTTEGFSGIFCVLLFITFWSWLVYGIVKRDKYIIIANAPGTIAVCILMSQFIFYR